MTRPERIWIWLGSLGFAIWSAPILSALHQRWLNAGFEHGYPIALLSLALIVMTARRYRIEERRPSWIAVPALVVMMTVAYVGHSTTIAIVPELVFPAALLAFAWAIFGASTARAFLAPVGFIYFAIPFWQIFDAVSVDVFSLNESLRQLTTHVTSVCVRLTNIPAYIEGDFITIPSGTFEIADGCSGRGYFIVAFELTVFYSIAFLKTTRARALMVIAGCAAALLGNWIRVYIIILIGYFSEMKSPVIKDHETVGWVVFALMFIPVLYLGRRLELGEARRKEPAEQPPVRFRNTAKVPVLATAAVGVVFFAAMSARFHLSHFKLNDEAPENISAVSIDEWQPAGTWDDGTVPVYRNPASDLAVRYRSGDSVAGVYVANFPVQRQGSEAIYFAHRPEGRFAQIQSRDDIPPIVSEGQDVFFDELLVQEGSQKRVVWHAIRIAGRNASSPLNAKYLQLIGAIKGRTDAQVLVLSAECSPTTNCEKARSSLEGLAAAAAYDIFEAAYSASPQ